MPLSPPLMAFEVTFTAAPGLNKLIPERPPLTVFPVIVPVWPKAKIIPLLPEPCTELPWTVIGSELPDSAKMPVAVTPEQELSFAVFRTDELKTLPDAVAVLLRKAIPSTKPGGGQTEVEPSTTRFLMVTGPTSCTAIWDA